MRKTFLTIALWFILILACGSVAFISFCYFVVIGLFGRDGPDTTNIRYFGMLAVPLAVLLSVVMGAYASLWLWEQPRGQYVAFPLALGLAAIAYGLMLKLVHR